MALRILRSKISRAPHAASGFAVCPLRNLRQPGTATHRGGARFRPSLYPCAAPGSSRVSLRTLPQQILLRKAPPARRQKRGCGLGSLTRVEYQAGYHIQLRPRSMKFSVFATPTLCRFWARQRMNRMCPARGALFRQGSRLTLSPLSLPSCVPSLTLAFLRRYVQPATLRHRDERKTGGKMPAATKMIRQGARHV